MTIIGDVESNRAPFEKELKLSEGIPDKSGEVTKAKRSSFVWWRKTKGALEKRVDVEFRGCTPVPYDERIETNYLNIFTIWFSISCNPLP
jgi:hypothetical protein